MFFPDSTRLVRLTGLRQAEIWDAPRAAKLVTTDRLWPADEDNWNTGRHLAVHPAGRLLAAQHWGVVLWDLEAQRPLFVLPREPGVPECLEWDPAGDRLAIGCDDGSLVLWNLPAVRAELERIGLGW